MKCPRCEQDTLVRDGSTPSGKPKWRCRGTSGDRKHCYTTVSPQDGERDVAGNKRERKTVIFERTIGRSTSRFLITAAQNGTPVHKKFLRALEIAAKHLSAEILVVPTRYKNPTSRWTESQENAEVWDDAVQPYLYNQRVALNKNLVLLGDVKVQPTAVTPLTGFEALTHGESGILAHTKLQLRTIPTPQSRYPKILTTTGACTVPNYTDSKTGKLGAFHHTIGAALIELRGKKFHLRQINADKKTGAFQDLNTVYGVSWRADGVWEEGHTAALVMGDTHVRFIDPAVKKATFGKDGIVETLRPEELVWHDVLDAYAVNPHHRGNPFVAVAKHRAGFGDAEAEMHAALTFIRNHTPPWGSAVVVESNHNEMLRRWLSSHDWRTDPVNAEFYLQTALDVVKGAKMGPHGAEYPDPFIAWAKQALPEAVVLRQDESYTIEGIEVGMHGDDGPNGSRGSVRNLRRIGVKSIIGHSHSPGIEEGCYQVGTSTALRAEYTRGPGSWLNTHCLIYGTGKRTLINIIDGEWRL